MKFKLVKPNLKNVGAYGYLAGLDTGSVIELHGHLAEKAKKNPDFEEVGKNSKVSITLDEAEEAYNTKIQQEAMFTREEIQMQNLQQQIADLQAQMTEREEEGTSTDDVFLDDPGIDDGIDES